MIFNPAGYAAPLTTTRLRLTVALPPARIENSNPLALLPWHPPKNPWPPPATGHDRHAQAAAFSEWKLAQNPQDFWVFSDGSKLDDGRAGAGWVLYRGEHRIASGHTPCGQYAEVFDAEASSLALGLQAATTHLAACAANNLWACLDNAAVVESAQRGTGRSSQKNLQAAAELLESWATRPRSMEDIARTGQAHVLWVPGHAGVMGNELADIEAKKAAALPLERHPKEATAAGAALDTGRLEDRHLELLDELPTPPRPPSSSPWPRLPPDFIPPSPSASPAPSGSLGPRRLCQVPRTFRPHLCLHPLQMRGPHNSHTLFLLPTLDAKAPAGVAQQTTHPSGNTHYKQRRGSVWAMAASHQVLHGVPAHLRTQGGWRQHATRDCS